MNGSAVDEFDITQFFHSEVRRAPEIVAQAKGVSDFVHEHRRQRHVDELIWDWLIKCDLSVGYQ